MKSAAIILLVTSMCVISGCNKQPEKLYTVDELYENKELRQQILAECKEKLALVGNYEKLIKQDPNCAVAYAAAKRYSSKFNSSQNKQKIEYKSIFDEKQDK